MLVTRPGHSLGNKPTLEKYCAALDLVVSERGDTHGYVDAVLAQQGYRRRVGLAVPNFMLALAIIAETEFVAALPERIVVTHASRFRLVSAPIPTALRRFQIRAIALRVVLMDAGAVWLLDTLWESLKGEPLISDKP